MSHVTIQHFAISLKEKRYFHIVTKQYIQKHEKIV